MTGPIPTPYEELLWQILENGTPKSDRTVTGTISVFGKQLRYDLSDSFPLLTTKKWCNSKALSASCCGSSKATRTSAGRRKNYIRICNDWADDNGDLGRSTACSDAPGRPRTARTSTRFKALSTYSHRTPSRAATSSSRGTSPSWTRWPSCRATCSSSSTPPTANCPCRSTSVPRTCSTARTASRFGCRNACCRCRTTPASPSFPAEVWISVISRRERGTTAI